MSTFVYKGGRGGQKSQKNGYVVCVRPLGILFFHQFFSDSCDFIFNRDNFHKINNSIVDALILEAVERDDLESIECILSWRNVKARSIGVSKTDQELLRMHEKA